MIDDALEAATELLASSVMNYRGQPVGTVAAMDPAGAVAANYHDCFIRDFIPSALVFMADGNHAIVRNFLLTVLELRSQHKCIHGHELEPAMLPASFRVIHDLKAGETIRADFGDQAIGRVAPVDAMMWWVILLGIYRRMSGDRDLARDERVQRALRSIMDLTLKEGFEVFPTLLVPDGAFMIDRRMGVYGHPLEIQALFYAMLITAIELLDDKPENRALIDLSAKRATSLRSYLRFFYWLDLNQLRTIHRYQTEEFGDGSINMLNIYPESIPEWVADWLPDRAGYLVGNLGPGRMDFRFFALGNLLSILFGVTTRDEGARIMFLYSDRWPDLIGEMPCKLVYPAVTGKEWSFMTGSDPKNVPWSYHNGGNWPVLLWAFTAAALKTGRGDLAQLAIETADRALPTDHWPEYYDGKRGNLIGRRAHLNQLWTVAGYLFAHRLMENESLLDCFPQGPDG
ncbi:glycoside hydrolase 100 family protein [Thiorhodococcus minor]|uniref:beta-fructofuranosidase n=1 Tax=Thiorhodococcus minor TaxID=57489 RepID=A0A6M0JTZ8_9GAMM|nr:glycoside hydrolase 100 family protein [Thiorhodococcus minor]NEV60998.1 alkaline invertase [Thiorhodococcus minor]